MRKEINKLAVTIKEISGASIGTIPVGTEFLVTWYSPDIEYSMCSGLGIYSIWNDEFEFRQ